MSIPYNGTGGDAADWKHDPETFREHVERTRRPAEEVFADIASESGNTGNTGENPATAGPGAVPGPENAPGTPGTLPAAAVSRPCYATHEQWVRVDGKAIAPGLWWHGFKQRGQGEPEPVDEQVSSAIWCIATTRDEHGASHGRRLKFADNRGRWKEFSAPMAMLSGSGEDLRRELLDQGLVIFHERHLKRWLMQQSPEAERIAATTTGWHDIDGGRAFVLPSRTIGSDEVLFQSEQAAIPDFEERGSLDGWREGVAALCIGNPTLILSVCIALAGLLLKLTHLHVIGGAGVHLFGDSSKGKSTGARAAASVWGGAAMLRSWRATSNGLEAAFASLNDTCIILDEIGEAHPREVGAVVYALGNGQGKARANRSGNARHSKRWRLMALSTGEHSVTAHIETGGDRSKAGQDVRLLSLPATDRAHGFFDELHEHPNGGAFADAVKAATEAHYGHAGPALVAALLDAEDLGERLREARAAFDAAAGLEGRAAGTFALIGLAGELATEHGITGWRKGAAMEAAREIFDCWRRSRGTASTEDARILESVQTFIGRHESRFQVGSDVPMNRAGWFRDGEYLFLPDALAEASGFDATRAAQALQRASWLTKHDPERLTKKWRIDGKGVNVYVIRPTEEGSP